MSLAPPRIRVCAAVQGEVREVWVDWSPGLSLGAAARQAGLVPPDEIAGIGVFGLRADAETLVREGDRVEIYRRLPHEPREHRRARAARADRVRKRDQ